MLASMALIILMLMPKEIPTAVGRSDCSHRLIKPARATAMKICTVPKVAVGCGAGFHAPQRPNARV